MTVTKPLRQTAPRPGSRIVSNSFDMGAAWPADQRVPLDGTAIFLWRVQ